MNLIQSYVRLHAPRRFGSGTSLLMAPSEYELRLAAYREKYWRELQARFYWDRMQLTSRRATELLMRPMRRFMRIARRATKRAPRAARSPALASDPDPAQEISLRIQGRAYDSDRAAAFLFEEHKNENAEPASSTFSSRSMCDVYGTTTRRVA
jgi:hypothetical protein